MTWTVQVNQTDARGRTALHKSAENGRIFILKHLIDCGADTNLADDEGTTAIHSSLARWVTKAYSSSIFD